MVATGGPSPGSGPTPGPGPGPPSSSDFLNKFHQGINLVGYDAGDNTSPITPNSGYSCILNELVDYGINSSFEVFRVPILPFRIINNFNTYTFN